MVKLFFLAVCYKHDNKCIILRSAADLNTFSFFQKNSVHDFMKFTSRTIVERTELASRVSVKEQDYLCHCYVRSNRLASIVISDQEYPHRVAHSLITNILDEFEKYVPQTKWTTLEENTVAFTPLEPALKKYQNPAEGDAMTRLQNDLDETKIILHNTIQAVLQRGEKLDDLVAKSDDLSAQSKVFYKTARKTNQCCSYIP